MVVDSVENNLSTITPGEVPHDAARRRAAADEYEHQPVPEN